MDLKGILLSLIVVLTVAACATPPGPHGKMGNAYPYTVGTEEDADFVAIFSFSNRNLMFDPDQSVWYLKKQKAPNTPTSSGFFAGEARSNYFDGEFTESRYRVSADIYGDELKVSIKWTWSDEKATHRGEVEAMIPIGVEHQNNVPGGKYSIEWKEPNKPEVGNGGHVSGEERTP